MINSRKLTDLRPDVERNCRALIEICKAAKLDVLITQTLRDNEYQEKLYAQGRTEPGQIVTNSRVTDFHGAGLAIDFCKNVKGHEYDDLVFFEAVGAAAKELGFSWGGDWRSFPDRPHIQWDAGGRYTGKMVLAGKLPPEMPAYTGKEEEDVMKTVRGATQSETKMIKAIQAAVGAVQDGEIGAQTMSAIACRLGADCFPLTVEIYGMPVIIAKNVVPFSPKGPLAGWGNSINGGFLAGSTPWSIMIQDGKVKRSKACHSSLGFPESVIYRLWNGTGGIKRVKTAEELPGGVRWAVGGMGLLENYDPAAEGFCKITGNGKTEDYSDVLRDTDHAMLGFKEGYYYLVYLKSMTGAQVNAFAKKLCLEYAVMLDGGSMAAMNGAESFAKIGVKTTQYYAIQGEREI